MKRCPIAIALVFAWALLVNPADAESPKKFNVLMLMGDDWRPEIGCYGSPGMLTPNVDKLAAGGVRFDRAYCQFPVCNPSRAAMLTSHYPNATGVVFNGTKLRDLHPDWTTLPEYFKQHGYVTANSGKIFHGNIPDPQSWTEAVADHVPSEFRRARSAAAKSEAKADGDGGEGSGPPGVKFIMLEGDGQSDKDYHIASDGIQFIEKYKNEPFFIGIGFHRPHAIPTAPKRFYDLYDAAKMRLPPDFAPRPTLPAGIPAVALPTVNDPYMSDDTSPETAREVIRAYRASASWTDWNMGRVLDTLERLRLADRTIVVFASDHGYHNGEKGRWGKTTVFEIALRAPLVIRIPGSPNAGRTCVRPVQLIDLYPTLAELCGLPKPPDVQGHSLVPLLKDPGSAWPYPACSMAKTGGGPLGYSIRTERWHYAEWEGGKKDAVLFDVAADPYEDNNLAQDPQQAGTVAEMKAGLAKAFGPMPSKLPKPAARTASGAK